MRTISATTRIALGLASITLSAAIVAGLLGLIPDRNRAVLEGRSRLCESTAISFTLLAAHDQAEQFQAGLEAMANRNPDLLSAAIRQPDGEFVARVGDHEQRWNHPATRELPGAQMFVPIMQNGEPWGTIEFCFEPLTTGWWHNLWVAQGLRLPVFLALVCGCGAWFYLRRVLRYLDPSKVVPTRVRQALDTLAEGLLLLDKEERIVLANRAFTDNAGVAEKQLLGRKASTLPWNAPANEARAAELPWMQALRGEMPPNGTMLSLALGEDESRTFMVNAAQIRDEQGRSQGALTSFSDVTPLEKKKAELAKMLSLVQSSAEEIHRQNQELERLATEDPLTGCRNRRSFFAAFEDAWSEAQPSHRALSCVMVDIDYFKSVNDRFGHSAGDDVLRHVAATLRRLARDTDVVCRYGGEEFCVLMRDTDADAAVIAAERLRQAIATIQVPQLQFQVTASFGVSAIAFAARSPQELLDQADKSLYAAKKNGRNRVVRFDRVPSDLVVDHA
jgi:diguanylate cyclase (GGDEF)-like protein/PAS domain S-box-containing protein